ncbi:cation diffusion facilitator [Trichophyton equinum CBS 127.97]|uniref:Cation diffusion facilitator n=1 Tax=Trichophyton equinum (strain ATCC MYA-4606 / CBS 127.97) TaxID=559882 RepID=F2Q475_TRIEC|nr:cation diffusion facilitator [Trichophyton equinum CBS 127.97]
MADGTRSPPHPLTPSLYALHGRSETYQHHLPRTPPSGMSTGIEAIEIAEQPLPVPHIPYAMEGSDEEGQRPPRYTRENDPFQLSTKIKSNAEIDQIQANTTRRRKFDIVMDRNESLEATHDVAEELQTKLESLPDVERAYVHVDYETTHKPEHFLKKEL